MIHPTHIQLCEIIDSEWDAHDVHDLVLTTPLRFDEDGLPVGYEAEQLFGLEGAHLGGRSL